ncbi:MAG: M20 family metallo-hydrolase [Ignavibacteriales bacterium]|nr:M20 family metallo-hydrolase [Ignavibacteriales bacterium]
MKAKWLVITTCFSVSCLFGQVQFRVNPARIEQRILALAEFGKSATGNQRVAFSDADVKGRAYVISLMKEASLSVRIDAAGNIIGRREGKNAALPPIMFGSHIDCVPNGGSYDGNVGVIGALECAQVLHENKVLILHPLEVVVFSDEEGGLIGSRAMIGMLSNEAMNVMSHSGKSVRDGIKFIGGNPDKIKGAARKKGDLKAFLELHIEQGGTLEAEKVDIGVVEGIVGIKWWNVDIEGFSNHAGTTPMDKRQDALVAAARYVLAVNNVMTRMPGRHVGTVGRISAEPGALNVIPGRVNTGLEIRDLSEKTIDRLFGMVLDDVKDIEQETKTRFTFALVEPTSEPAPTDERVRSLIEASAKELRLTSKRMPSGAGHDAQDMTHLAPTGMIFVPSVGGISHSPKEFTKRDDIANGTNVLLRTILRIDEIQ